MKISMALVGFMPSLWIFGVLAVAFLSVDEVKCIEDQSVLSVRIGRNVSKDVDAENTADNNKDRLSFHEKHGNNIRISNEGRTVQKIRSINPYDSVVFTNRPIRTNELFEVRVDNKTKVNKQNDYFVGIGFTSLMPKYTDIPPHMKLMRPSWLLYQDKSYVHGDEFGRKFKVNLDKIEVGQRFGIKRSEYAMLHLYVDGKDDGGPLLFGVPEEIYGIFEIYGNTGKYTLVS